VEGAASAEAEPEAEPQDPPASVAAPIVGAEVAALPAPAQGEVPVPVAAEAGGKPTGVEPEALGPAEPVEGSADADVSVASRVPTER
jgi:hypothetical protein